MENSAVKLTNCNKRQAPAELMGVLRILAIVSLLIVIHANSLSFALAQNQTKSERYSIHLLEQDSITPIIGAVLTFYSHEGDSLKIASDSEGFSFYEANAKWNRLKIDYMGNNLFDAPWVPQAQQTIYLSTTLVLSELQVVRQRALIRRTTTYDAVRIKGHPIFKQEDMKGVLELTPGVLIKDNNLTYLNHPVVGVRLGSRSSLRALDGTMLEALKNMRAEQVERIVFKRVLSSQHIQYELIIEQSHENSLDLSPSLRAFVGKKANVELGLFGQMSTEKLSSNLLLSGDLNKSMRSEEIVYENSAGRSSFHYKEDNKSRGLNIDYSLALNLNNISFGGRVELRSISDIDKRWSIKGEEEKFFLGDPITSRRLGGSLFANLQLGNHKLHWEGNYNTTRNHQALTSSGISLQDLREDYVTPNTTLDYNFSSPSGAFNLEARLSYAYLQHDSKDLLRSPLAPQRFSEHTWLSSAFALYTIGRFSIGGGLRLEHSRGVRDPFTTLLPRVMVGYQRNAFGATLEYNKDLQPPLVSMMSNNPIDLTDELRERGNSLLKPEETDRLNLNVFYKNAFANIGYSLRRNTLMKLPLLDQSSSDQLTRGWINDGRQELWSAYFGYGIRYKALYLSPSVNLELGRYIRDNERSRERYIAFNLPMQIALGRSKINAKFWYSPSAVHTGMRSNAMSNVELRYSYNLPKQGLTLTLFARDIFYQQSIEYTELVDRDYRYSVRQDKDRRHFGISITYSFSRGKVERIRGVTNNIIRE